MQPPHAKPFAHDSIVHRTGEGVYHDPSYGATCAEPRDVRLVLEHLVDGEVTYQDMVKVTVVRVDIRVQWMQELHEERWGEVLVRRHDGNDAPRKQVRLAAPEPAGWATEVSLQRSSTKVKVYDAEEGGNEITFLGGDSKFAVAHLPKTLWAQGHEASGSMRDVDLTMHVENHPDSLDDSAKLTILWVTVATDHTESLEEDNGPRDYYYNLVVPRGSYALGYHVFSHWAQQDPEQAWWGRGSELIGNVAPSDFDPGEFAGLLRLVRWTTSGNWFRGPEGNELYHEEGAHEDTSDYTLRDDDPQSGGSNGRLYDIDAPGMQWWHAPPDTVFRGRVNFEEWADYDLVRCSEKKPWYTRQSYKKTGPCDFGTATSGTANTVTDSTKNWAIGLWVPGVIKITAGTGVKQVRQITASSATTIQVADDWSTVPDNTSEYVVNRNSTWTELNDVPGDNSNADGTTPITWNLQ